MEAAPESSYAQTLVESLTGLDVESFLEILKHVLADRGDFVQPLVSLLVPEIIYPPATILKARRCVGTVKNYFPDNRCGYISCPAIQEEFQKDSLVYASQLRDFSIGAQVNFAVCLKDNGEPLAYDLHAAAETVPKIMCKFFGRGLCNEGTSCRFSHEGAQDSAANTGMLCPWFAKGFCNEGDACPYIHDGSFTERQPTAQCKWFAQGYCNEGDACPLAHGPSLLPGVEGTSCNSFAKGFCAHGDACKFNHGQSATSPPNEASVSCKLFAQGRCSIGNACKFTHVQRSGAGFPADGRKRSFTQGPGVGLESHISQQRRSFAVQASSFRSNRQFDLGHTARVGTPGIPRRREPSINESSLRMRSMFSASPFSESSI